MIDDTPAMISARSDGFADLPRVATTGQAMMVIAVQLLPVLAIISLAPALPEMLRAFSAVPNSQALVFVALTVPGLCIALFAGAMGFAVDRYGRRPVLLLAMLGYAVLGTAPVLLDNLVAIILSRVGLGIAEAAIMTSATTLLCDYFDGPVRAKWIAIQSSVISVSATALFFVGGLLATISWRAPFLLYASALPLLICAYFTLWEPARQASAASDAPGSAVDRVPVDRRWFAIVLATTLAGAIGFYVAPIQISIILASHGVIDPAKAGLAGAVGTLGVPIGALFFKRHVSRWSVAGLLALAFLTIGLGLVGMGLLIPLPAIVASMVVNQFGCGVLLSALIHWMMGGLPPAWRGRGNGWWTSVFFLGQFLSPLAVTLIGFRSGGVGAACAIIGTAGALLGLGWIQRMFHAQRARQA